ncbi:hypothetical protein CDD80_364 [Ophiocordyceps camponoti-rufipedis]|uniref:AA1-like domain-containing protein n=1 Tax=Ophiocordyceps camponoti-rufipedis TaxID=2004952 RepID=A0A2C5ZMR3_9HYPO|nr:hypothetical protein CDD80_364 [Ophiocordyceps camponoti-rufipedis]
MHPFIILFAAFSPVTSNRPFKAKPLVHVNHVEINASDSLRGSKFHSVKVQLSNDTYLDTSCVWRSEDRLPGHIFPCEDAMYHFAHLGRWERDKFVYLSVYRDWNTSDVLANAVLVRTICKSVNGSTTGSGDGLVCRQQHPKKLPLPLSPYYADDM